jgi:hypothetical protein
MNGIDQLEDLGIGKVKLSHYTPWRCLGGEDI